MLIVMVMVIIQGPFYLDFGSGWMFLIGSFGGYSNDIVWHLPIATSNC